MRQLWVGCYIKGFLWSPYCFCALNMDACIKALRENNPNKVTEVEKYIRFLTSNPHIQTFVFEGCFDFVHKDFEYVKSLPFGGSLAGQIVHLRP